MSNTQTEYLRQMGIPVWVRRQVTQAAATESLPHISIRLGPGDGGCMFLCGAAEESASRLASDLSRLLPEPAVWAWPDSDGTGGSLEAAVEGRLLTQIVVYGEELAHALFEGNIPNVVGQASIVVVPSLTELKVSAQKRKQCWQQLDRAAVIKPE